jgi:hypothetical protein
MSVAPTKPEDAAVVAAEKGEDERGEDISPELQEFLNTDQLVGLSSAEAASRLTKFGPNELPEKRVRKCSEVPWLPIPLLECRREMSNSTSHDRGTMRYFSLCDTHQNTRGYRLLLSAKT